MSRLHELKSHIQASKQESLSLDKYYNKLGSLVFRSLPTQK